MAKRISFTKAEMEAVRGVVDGVFPGVGLKTLRTLLTKMEAANQPEPAKLTGGPDGVAASEFCRLLSGSIVEPATKLSWVMLQRQLVSEPFSQSDLLELDLSWANSPIPALTVARKGKDWLAKQRAARKGKPGRATGAPADMEFDDE